MKLYRRNGDVEASVTWAGTQVRAKRLFGKDGYELVDVPTNKDGLIDFLNEVTEVASTPPVFGVTITHPDAYNGEVEEANGNTANTNDARVSGVARAIDIEEEIADADFARAINLSEHILGRLDEHVRRLSLSKLISSDGSDLIG